MQSQPQKTTYCMIPFMQKFKRDKPQLQKSVVPMSRSGKGIKEHEEIIWNEGNSILNVMIVTWL